MPADLTALLNLIGDIGQQLLDSFTYIFGWVFTIDNNSLTNLPVLIPIFMMVLIFIKKLHRTYYSWI